MSGSGRSRRWLLPLLVLAICGLGITTVYSASYTPGREGLTPLAARQLTWFGGGVVGMLAVMGFDYRRLARRAYVVCALILASVLAVPAIGEVAGG